MSQQALLGRHFFETNFKKVNLAGGSKLQRKHEGRWDLKPETAPSTHHTSMYLAYFDYIMDLLSRFPFGAGGGQGLWYSQSDLSPDQTPLTALNMGALGYRRKLVEFLHHNL